MNQTQLPYAMRAIPRRQLTAAEVLARLQAIPQRSSLHIRPALLQEIVARVKREFNLSDN